MMMEVTKRPKGPLVGLRSDSRPSAGKNAGSDGSEPKVQGEWWV